MTAEREQGALIAASLHLAMTAESAVRTIRAAAEEGMSVERADWLRRNADRLEEVTRLWRERDAAYEAEMNRRIHDGHRL